MRVDPSRISPEACYKLLIGCVVPRTIAWVTSLSDDGVVNLAPFSCFMFLAGPTYSRLGEVVVMRPNRAMDGGEVV